MKYISRRGAGSSPLSRATIIYDVYALWMDIAYVWEKPVWSTVITTVYGQNTHSTDTRYVFFATDLLIVDKNIQIIMRQYRMDIASIFVQISVYLVRGGTFWASIFGCGGSRGWGEEDIGKWMDDLLNLSPAILNGKKRVGRRIDVASLLYFSIFYGIYLQLGRWMMLPG